MSLNHLSANRASMPLSAMHSRFVFRETGWLLAAMIAVTMSAAEESSPVANAWLAGAKEIPQFPMPASREEWGNARQQIRATLSPLLGDLPPRPARPVVKTLS